mgnify:CR=1 FL=1
MDNRPCPSQHHGSSRFVVAPHSFAHQNHQIVDHTPHQVRIRDLRSSSDPHSASTAGLAHRSRFSLRSFSVGFPHPECLRRTFRSHGQGVLFGESALREAFFQSLEHHHQERNARRGHYAILQTPMTISIGHQKTTGMNMKVCCVEISLKSCPARESRILRTAQATPVRNPAVVMTMPITDGLRVSKPQSVATNPQKNRSAMGTNPYPR